MLGGAGADRAAWWACWLCLRSAAIRAARFWARVCRRWGIMAARSAQREPVGGGWGGASWPVGVQQGGE